MRSNFNSSWQSPSPSIVILFNFRTGSFQHAQGQVTANTSEYSQLLFLRAKSWGRQPGCVSAFLGQNMVGRGGLLLLLQINAVVHLYDDESYSRVARSASKPKQA